MRDVIDRMPRDAEEVRQDNRKIDFNAGSGVAVRVYQTDAGGMSHPMMQYALLVEIM